MPFNGLCSVGTFAALARTEVRIGTAEDVSVFDALAADHDRAVIVIKAVGHRLADEADRLLHHVITFDLDDVVWIVKADAVAALAGADAGDRSGEDEPGLVVLRPPGARRS
jgi:hypothetical protein